MITKNEAYEIALGLYPEIEEKLSKRIIDEIPDSKCDFTFLDYKVAEAFWLVQYCSITRDYNWYGNNDYRLCFNGIWISKKSGRIIKKEYYYKIDGLGIDIAKYDLSNEAGKIEFELKIRERSLDVELGMKYDEVKGWHLIVPIKNPPRIKMSDLPKEMFSKKQHYETTIEFEIDVDYTKGVALYPIKTYLNRWGRTIDQKKRDSLKNQKNNKERNPIVVDFTKQNITMNEEISDYLKGDE